MKSGNRRKQNSENVSKFEAYIRNILESFIRKTDAEKRTALLGVDPFRN